MCLLEAPEQQAKAAIYGVRPFVDSAAALLSPVSNITIVNGADPNVSRETGIPSLAFPTVPIAIQAANLFKEVCSTFAMFPSQTPMLPSVKYLMYRRYISVVL